MTTTINEHGKKIASKKNILDRIQFNGKEERFTTLKDHRTTFKNIATRLINAAKNEIGRTSKVILENVNKEFINKEDGSINFVRQHVNIKIEDFSIVQHARKSLLYNKKILWQKKNTNLFDVAMGAYNEAEVCEIGVLFLLTNLAN